MTLTPSRRAFICALSISALGILALASAALAQPAENQGSLPDVLGPWLGLVAVVISVASTIYAWLTSRSKDNAVAVDGIKKDHSELAARVQTIETEMRHLPAKDDVNELKLAMAEIKGSVAVFNEGLGSLSRTVRRIEDYLTKAEGK